MAVNVQKLGAISRSDLVWFDPDDLVIVTDKDHPLYDERAALEVSKELVKNIKVYGVLEPIVARFNQESGKTEVVDGRQRVMAARVAKKEQEAAGEIAVRVPAVIRRDDDEGVVGIMISANEQRRADTTKIKAKKAKRMLDMGMTKKEVGVAFGVSTQTVTNWVEGRKAARAASNKVTRKMMREKLEELAGDDFGDYQRGYAEALAWVLGDQE